MVMLSMYCQYCQYSFEVIIFNKLHHFSLEASYPIGYAEWEASELVESTLSFKCSVRLLTFFMGYLEVERTELFH